MLHLWFVSSFVSHDNKSVLCSVLFWVSPSSVACLIFMRSRQSTEGKPLWGVKSWWEVPLHPTAHPNLISSKKRHELQRPEKLSQGEERSEHSEGCQDALWTPRLSQGPWLKLYQVEYAHPLGSGNGTFYFWFSTRTVTARDPYKNMEILSPKCYGGDVSTHWKADCFISGNCKYWWHL